MTAGARRVDVLAPERLLEFADTRSDRAEREALIDLAGHWKHGYIPLDAVAWAIKMKHQRGDGKRRRGIGDQSHLEPYRGHAGGPSKSRLDPKGAAAHAGIIAGTRSKGRPRGAAPGSRRPSTPDASASSTRPDVKAAAAAAVRLRAPELRDRAAKGDKVAAAELNRREAKRAAKTSPAVEEALHAKYSAAKTPREKELAASNLAEHYRAAGKTTPAKNWQRTAEKHAPAEPSGASTPEHIKAMTPEQMRAELAPKSKGVPGVDDRAPGTPAEAKRAAALESSHAAAPVAPSSSKPKRKPSALIQEYRSRREEQDRRFEAHAGGGIAAQDTHTQEYKDYFGVGDHSTTPQEQRLTYKGFLEERRQASEHDRRMQNAYDHGARLGAAHGTQEDTSKHEDEYRHHAAGHDEEMFGQGYSDGILAAADKADKAEKANAYETARKAAGDATSASHRAATEASHKTAGHAHIAAGQAALAHGDRGQARYHVAQAQIHADAAKRAHTREEADRLRSDPRAMSAHLRERSVAAGNPQTDAEKLEWTRDHNVAARVLTTAEGRTGGQQATPADAAQVLKSRWTTPGQKAAARKLAQDRHEQVTAETRKRMESMPDAELAKMLREHPLSSSSMPAEQKRAIAAVARERLAARKAKPAKETPEEVAKRIGMEFVKPTLKGHAIIGEGATVEKAAPRAGDFTTEHRAALNRALEATGKARASGKVSDHRDAAIAHRGAARMDNPRAAQHRRVAELHDRTATRILRANELTGLRRQAEAHHEEHGVGPHGLKPGDKIRARNVGTAGTIEGKYIGRDINGKPRIQYAHGGQIVTTSVSDESKIEPFNPTSSSGALAGPGGDWNAIAAMNRGRGPEAQARLASSIQSSNDAKIARDAAAYPVGTKVTVGPQKHPAEVIDHRAGGIKVRLESGRETFVQQDSLTPAAAAPQGVRGHTEAELRHQAATPDTRMGARAAAELERRGLPAEPHLTTRLAASQSHPLGAIVDAKQPGIDRTTRGVVAGHTPEGMVRVAYKDHRGDTTTGTFNPSHTTVVSKPAEGGNVSSLGAKQAERAEQTPRQIHERLQADPSKVSMDELQRLSRLGGTFSKAANAEIGRRDAAQMAREGRDPIAESEALANRIAGPNSWRRPAPGTTRLEGNQSIVITGPNAGKITEGEPSGPAGEARRFGQAANAGERANIGQAQAEARKAAQGPPKQGEMFGATGEHQPDIFEEGQPSAAGRDTSSAPSIRVEHSGDGTVVYGTQRGDTDTTAALKGQGFKWSRSLGGWYLPRTWSESTREMRVRGLEARLGNKIEVQRGDIGRSGTAAERSQATIDRAKEIADAQRARAEKFRQESDAQDAAARRISDNIPFGQPILVGHHSQRRAEKDQERIHNGMRRSIEADSNARAAEDRAGSAEARARMQTDPRAAARRLERSEAELRAVERRLNGTGKEIHGENHPATGEYADRLKARQQELRQNIEHDRGIAGDLVAGPTGEAKYGRHNVKPGDVVHVGGSPAVVHSVGPKNAKVMTNVGPLPYPYSQIRAHGPLEDASTDTLKKMLANSDRIASFGNSPRSFPPAVLDRIKSILRSRGEG